MTSGDFGRPPLAPLARAASAFTGVFARPIAAAASWIGDFLGVFILVFVFRRGLIAR